eukprot:TRINITY_DN79382_c0_g1_i1.p1 TRINITY_DN79382_c0_g1~~TRINITY_DN79382_c0_g1_i1.p1  ORF type:complete len:147 (-),score=9.33 TRINITY_DN79382_c0_g1_i1:116-556(-)
MATWTSMFGEKLTTKNGAVATSDVLKNKKRIGVYFSAHWCPPCRKFTPLLAQFYQDAKEVDADGLEIVFVSADSDQKSFDEYYNEMPWVSTIYGTDVNDVLSNKFDVSGIPMFIILDGETGAVKDNEGRGTVSSAKGDVNACFNKW